METRADCQLCAGSMAVAARSSRLRPHGGAARIGSEAAFVVMGAKRLILTTSERPLLLRGWKQGVAFSKALVTHILQADIFVIPISPEMRQLTRYGH